MKEASAKVPYEEVNEEPSKTKASPDIFSRVNLSPDSNEHPISSVFWNNSVIGIVRSPTFQSVSYSEPRGTCLETESWIAVAAVMHGSGLTLTVKKMGLSSL